MTTSKMAWPGTTAAGGAIVMMMRVVAIFPAFVLPFALAELNVRITVEIGYALVAVTSLSFIGLGAERPTPEWGLLIADGRRYVTGAWWYPIFPGIAIYAATTIFSLFGDALAERIRPGQRRARR